MLLTMKHNSKINSRFSSGSYRVCKWKVKSSDGMVVFVIRFSWIFFVILNLSLSNLVSWYASQNIVFIVNPKRRVLLENREKTKWKTWPGIIIWCNRFLFFYIEDIFEMNQTTHFIQHIFNHMIKKLMGFPVIIWRPGSTTDMTGSLLTFSLKCF